MTATLELEMVAIMGAFLAVLVIIVTMEFCNWAAHTRAGQWLLRKGKR